MPRRLRLLPGLGANALEPRNSGGVSLIDATSKARGPATGAEVTGGCAWLGKAPNNASPAGQNTSKLAPLGTAAVSLIKQVRGIFTDVGRQRRWERWQNQNVPNSQQCLSERRISSCPPMKSGLVSSPPVNDPSTIEDGGRSGFGWKKNSRARRIRHLRRRPWKS